MMLQNPNLGAIGQLPMGDVGLPALVATPLATPLAPPFTDTALGGTPTTARESGGSHSDFTALLVPPAVQKVQPGPIRHGSKMVEVEAG